MNYLDLINKCLVELNYKTCDSFTDLVKNDHKKIKNILNVINAEVCNFNNWNFLLRKLQLELPKNTGETANTINGKIHSVYVDNVKYQFVDDFGSFMLKKSPSNSFTVFNDKLLFPLFDETKTVDVIYYTSYCAQNIYNEDIESMTNADDVSVIPSPYVEPLLTYGTCLRLKGSTEYSKFSYWYDMYNKALADMRAKISPNAFESPVIKLQRQS